MIKNSESVIDEFRDFVRLGEPLLPTLRAEPAAGFRHFVRESIPLLLEPIRASLAVLGPNIALIRRWLVSHDLLRVAGFTYAEDPYTELIAWALHPDTHPPSALLRQQAWLARFPFGSVLSFDHPARLRTQFWTDDGVPDLILEFETFVVVVEAKTGSEEHLAPSGAPQTLAYPDAVRRALRLPPSKPLYTVFITPDRRSAANAEASNTTFVEFVLSLASCLDTIELPQDLRSAYAMLFTHFLTCAVPPGIDFRAVLQQAAEWMERLDDDTFVLGRLDEIATAITLLGTEAFK